MSCAPTLYLAQSSTTPFQINDEPKKWSHSVRGNLKVPSVIQKIRNSPTIWFPCAPRCTLNLYKNN
uniref:Uncharacterized protein n=1 Tax=viral metagenome TaxID=1070528 RepID=A0A6C0AEC6_9ZZZZ